MHTLVTWEGTPSAGQSMVFTSLYYPHLPYRPDKVSNNPSQGQTAAAWKNQSEDNVDQTLLSLELEEGNQKWIWFNPAGQSIQLNGQIIQSPFGYQKAAKP